MYSFWRTITKKQSVDSLTKYRDGIKRLHHCSKLKIIKYREAYRSPIPTITSLVLSKYERGDSIQLRVDYLWFGASTPIAIDSHTLTNGISKTDSWIPYGISAEMYANKGRYPWAIFELFWTTEIWPKAGFANGAINFHHCKHKIKKYSLLIKVVC